MVPSTSSEAQATVETCPICDSQIDLNVPKCNSCGFPTALLPEARRAVQEEEASHVSSAGVAVPALVEAEGGPPAAEPAPVVLPLLPAGPARPPTSAGGLNMEQTAVALQASLRVAQMMGMDTSTVASALTAAAMAAARGAMDESLKVLKDAYDQLEPEIGKRFEQMAVQLEEQEGRLREEGIAADVAREVSHSRTAFEEGSRIDAVETLSRAEKAMNELEHAWKQVKETLLRVDALRETGQRLGMDLSKADERLGQVRETLAEENISAATLQEAGTQASAALVLLHEQVRNQVALLGQQAIRGLKARPPPPGEREKAEVRLKIILGHARAGRLKEASDEMLQFRATYLEKAEATTVATAASEVAAASAASKPVPPSGKAPAPKEPSKRAASEAAPPPSPTPAPAAAPAPVPAQAPKEAPLAPATPETPTPKEATSVRESPRESVETKTVGPVAPPERSTAPAPESPKASSFETGSGTVPRPSAAVPAAAAPPEVGPSGAKLESKEAGPGAATPSPAPRTMSQLIAEARELGRKVQERQKKKESTGKAGALIKELPALLKAGKAAEVESKLAEIRHEIGDG